MLRLLNHSRQGHVENAGNDDGQLDEVVRDLGAIGLEIHASTKLYGLLDKSLKDQRVHAPRLLAREMAITAWGKARHKRQGSST